MLTTLLIFCESVSHEQRIYKKTAKSVLLQELCTEKIMSEYMSVVDIEWFSTSKSHHLKLLKLEGT